MTDIITIVEAIVVAVEVSQKIVGSWGRPLERRQLEAAYNSAFTRFFDSYGPGDHALVVDPNFFTRPKVAEEMGKLSRGYLWDLAVIDAQFHDYDPSGDAEHLHENLERLYSYFIEEFSEALPLASRIILQFNKIALREQKSVSAQLSKMEAKFDLKVDRILDSYKSHPPQTVADINILENVKSILRRSAFETLPTLIESYIDRFSTFNILRDAVIAALDLIEIPIDVKYQMIRLIDMNVIDKTAKEYIRSEFDMDLVLPEVYRILMQGIDFEMLGNKLDEIQRNGIKDKKPPKTDILSALDASIVVPDLNKQISETVVLGLPSEDKFAPILGEMFRDAFLSAVNQLGQH